MYSCLNEYWCRHQFDCCFTFVWFCSSFVGSIFFSLCLLPGWTPGYLIVSKLSRFLLFILSSRISETLRIVLGMFSHFINEELEARRASFLYAFYQGIAQPSTQSSLKSLLTPLILSFSIAVQLPDASWCSSSSDNAQALPPHPPSYIACFLHPILCPSARVIFFCYSVVHWSITYIQISRYICLKLVNVFTGWTHL